MTPNPMMLNRDQHFLLIFIMGTYFAPDLVAENPKKPILQRIYEGLPPYTSEQLANTKMKILVAEQVYYHVVRRACKSVRVTLPIFRQFFQGIMSTPSYDPYINQQFPDLFPTHLHPQSRFRDRYKTVENILFIDDPDTSYIKYEDVERFQRLTGLNSFVLDRTAVERVTVGAVIKESKAESSQSGSQKTVVTTSEVGSSSSSQKRKRSSTVEVHIRPPIARSRPVMVMLPDRPIDEEWCKIVSAVKGGVKFSGSVAKRTAGPSVGLVDIGVRDDSYFFQVALPGVGSNENEFRCTVENDGRVLIEGVARTGGRYIHVKNKGTYIMQTQNLCPPGPFTVSFRLPGRVKARKLEASLEDGVLEGIVPKK